MGQRGPDNQTLLNQNKKHEWAAHWHIIAYAFQVAHNLQSVANFVLAKNMSPPIQFT